MNLKKLIPNTVKIKQPTKWLTKTNNPFTHSSLKKSSITSPEKEEKVVRAPRNPVTKNNRHSGLN